MISFFKDAWKLKNQSAEIAEQVRKTAQHCFCAACGTWAIFMQLKSAEMAEQFTSAVLFLQFVMSFSSFLYAVN